MEYRGKMLVECLLNACWQKVLCKKVAGSSWNGGRCDLVIRLVLIIRILARLGYAERKTWIPCTPISIHADWTRFEYVATETVPSMHNSRSLLHSTKTTAEYLQWLPLFGVTFDNDSWNGPSTSLERALVFSRSAHCRETSIASGLRSIQGCGFLDLGRIPHTVWLSCGHTEILCSWTFYLIGLFLR